MTRIVACVPWLFVVLGIVPGVSAQTLYQGPGTYSSYGNQTYGPGGAQSHYGNQVYTPQGTYSTYGNQTYGPGGSTYSTYGNMTYGPGGSTAATYGNQTYINTPGQRPVVCSHYGSQTFCN
ncbi:MAG: hypothetical protein WA280_00720 [Xanthobacteraceae bacterium]